jgi:peptide/nickel transport system ATP-binding protein
MTAVLEASGLHVAYRRTDGTLLPAVIGAALSLAEGESVGLVGESGSGKSTLARALMGYARPGGVITAGEVKLHGRDIRAIGKSEMRALRGGTVAFVPQNPLSSLTPHIRVGPQVAEAVAIHRRLDAGAARTAALELLEATGVPDPPRLYERFPHELSGGQRQRVVIAAALAGNPRLLILDEPTTALDKTTEIQVLELVQQLRRRFNAALVYVSHDLNVISEMCDRVLVMLEGRVVEEGPTRRVYREPMHEYTRALIAAVPRIDRGGAQVVATAAAPLLEVSGLTFRYPGRRAWLAPRREERPALADVGFGIAAGETLGLVGESGSGKSTAAAIVAGLLEPQAGHMRFDGEPLPALAKRRTQRLRQRIQIVFQDPLSSLNPRQRVGAILERPLAMFQQATGAEARRRAAALLETLQLDPALLDSYPRQLSGGQQQRVAIARAFAARPDLVICDEITSALDVSVQAQVLALLRELQQRSGAACLFISHDLGVIRQVAARVVVLKDGAVREAGPTADVLLHPRDPYTRMLVDAASRGYGNLPESPVPSP